MKEQRQVSLHFTSISWAQFQCEICKSSLPYVFVNNGRKYPLVTMPEVSRLSNYMILESITLENKDSRVVHILHPRHEAFLSRNANVWLIGRGQDCELKVSDISVSRNHCQINY